VQIKNTVAGSNSVFDRSSAAAFRPIPMLWTPEETGRLRTVVTNVSGDTHWMSLQLLHYAADVRRIPATVPLSLLQAYPSLA
jgi:hypothetical protein